jgi:hypothetical protein
MKYPLLLCETGEFYAKLLTWKHAGRAAGDTLLLPAGVVRRVRWVVESDEDSGKLRDFFVFRAAC